LAGAQEGSAAEKPKSPTKQATPALQWSPNIPSVTAPYVVSARPNPTATLDKVKALGEHLGRAVDLAFDLLSGNSAELFSKNRTALLSGNKTALLSGNSANLLSGNAPKLLSDNTTPILSGNSFSLLSNFKLEIHIENSGNGAGGLPGAGRTPPTTSATAAPSVPYASTYILGVGTVPVQVPVQVEPIKPKNK